MNETGIYVLGKSYDEQKDADLSEYERQKFGNYYKSGRAWERPVSIELFETGRASLPSIRTEVYAFMGLLQGNTLKNPCGSMPEAIMRFRISLNILYLLNSQTDL